jgi:hypothetical protein
MFKKIAAIAVVGTAMAGLAAPVQAHYVYTFSGWLYHSVECTVGVKSVPNPGTNPAKVFCDVVPTQATVWCANPNGYVFAGSAAVAPVTGSTDLTSAHITDKKRGIATVPVTTFDLTFGDLQAYVSYCPNTNWTVQRLVIEKFDSTIEVYDCGKDLSCSTPTLATVVNATCTLPPDKIGTIPPDDQAYDCAVTSSHED